MELIRSDLERDDRRRIMNLFTLDTHARDIVDMLIRENVSDKVKLPSRGIRGYYQQRVVWSCLSEALDSS